MLVRASSGSGGGGGNYMVIEGIPDSATINCGFPPKQIIVNYLHEGSASFPVLVAWTDTDASNQIQVNQYTSAYHIAVGSSQFIASINANGFTIGSSQYTTLRSDCRITVSG